MKPVADGPQEAASVHRPGEGGDSEPGRSSMAWDWPGMGLGRDGQPVRITQDRDWISWAFPSLTGRSVPRPSEGSHSSPSREGKEG